jgi:oligopeptide/dipeptide ABC transporter ATP-binding protein
MNTWRSLSTGLKNMVTNTSLLRVEGLRTALGSDGNNFDVVTGVDLELREGETVALVGESGSGKSVTALSIARLLGPRLRTVAGKVLLNGKDLLSLSEKGMRQLRGRDIAVVFQEPMTSLNPVLRIGTQLAESIRRNPGASSSVRDRAIALLESVGITNPESRVDMYPHQLSGGMRQRVMVATAVAARPRVLIADEPTTALDVTTQAQILDLMQARMGEFGAATLLITHDMGVVARYAQKVNVMYSGGIVERADVHSLFAKPAHPYTRGLLNSMPRLDRPRMGRLSAIEGLPPSVLTRPKGCPFQPRCTFRIDKCSQKPPLEAIDVGHEAACWRAREIASLPLDDRTNAPAMRSGS